MNTKDLIKLLDKRIEEANALQKLIPDGVEFENENYVQWRYGVLELLRAQYGYRSGQVTDFRSIQHTRTYTDDSLEVQKLNRDEFESALKKQKAILVAIKQRESAMDSKPTKAVGVNKLFEQVQLYPAIKEASINQFRRGEYRHAIRDGWEVLREKVRSMSGLKSDGADLMNDALSPKNPIIRLNQMETGSEKSAQRGLHQLGLAIVWGIRNVNEHEVIDQDPFETLEILGMMSYMAKKLDTRLEDANRSAELEKQKASSALLPS